MKNNNGKLTSFKDLKRVVKKKKPNSTMSLINYNFNTPNTFGEDGKDHINVNIYGDLHIGRFLDPSHRYEIRTSMGNFDSILNLIYWLRHPELDDSVRTYRRRKLHNLVSKVKLKRLNNHRLYLCYYTYQKVISSEKIVETIKRLRDDTVFLSYTTPNKAGIRITTGNAKMIIPVAIEVTNAIKEDREPRWELFIDRPIQEGDVVPLEIKRIINKHYGIVEEPTVETTTEEPVEEDTVNTEDEIVTNDEVSSTSLDIEAKCDNVEGDAPTDISEETLVDVIPEEMGNEETSEEVE